MQANWVKAEEAEEKDSRVLFLKEKKGRAYFGKGENCAAVT